MKMKYLFCLLLVLILSIGAVSADDKVTEFNGSFTDLNTDIGNASDGDVIELDCNYIHHYGDTSINVTKNLTIKGNGAIIDGNKEGIMEIHGDTNLSDITFQNSYGTDYGALKGSCNSLIINNCTFINNLAADGSCVINVKCSSLHINNSKFINNGVGSSWWMFDLQNCSIIIENSEFVGNGRSMRMSDCKVTVSNSHFEDNSYDFLSYGIFRSENSDFNIIGSQFISNYALQGGVINAFNSNLQIESCRFINNSADEGGALKGDSSILSIRNSWFENNTRAIKWKCDSLVIDGSTFKSNKGAGDAILEIFSNSTIINKCNFNYNHCTLINCNNVVKIYNSNFTNNDANGVFIEMYGGDAYIYNTQFINNKGYGNTVPTLVYFYGNKLSIINSRFVKNLQRTILVEDDVKSFAVNNCEFIQNGLSIDCYSKTAKITNTRFIKNNEIVCFLSENCRKYVVDRCNFTQNTGCPLSAMGDLGTITNCNFVKNRNEGVGAIYMGGKKSKLNNCLFVSNYGRDDGAVVWPDTGSITNCIFKYNTAVKADGALTCDINIASTNRFVGNTPAKLSVIRVLPDKVEYMSGKLLKFVVIEEHSKKRVPGVKITIYRDGINGRYYYLKTNSKGVASLDVSTFTASPTDCEYIVTYPKKYTLEKSGSFFDDTSMFGVWIASAKTIVKAPKIVNKKYFKVTVKHKTTKKPVKNLKLRIRVFTGKKYVKFAAVTNKNGVALLKTDKIKPGNHKVIVTSENGLYIVKAISSIWIK